MTESQKSEYKRSWRDEYLKWICGFANAQGGILDIGRDDRGEVVGLPDAVKLLEELPNKMRDLFPGPSSRSVISERIPNCYTTMKFTAICSLRWIIP